MRRRAQAAVEFLILLGFMLLVFAIFFLLIGERAARSEERASFNELAVIGDAIRDEVAIASSVHDGYTRTFFIPLSVERGAYTITLLPNGLTTQPNELTVSDGQTEYLAFLPVNLTAGSTVHPGYNEISRTNGTFRLTGVERPTGCSWSTDCLPGTVCVAGSCVACVDNDGDTYASDTSPILCPNADCDDNDALSNPGLPEDCNDPADNDCDNLKDVDDPDCYVPCPEGWCSIGGSCYNPGSANPSNACQYCDPLQSETSWSNRALGYSCDDGLYCRDGGSSRVGETCDGAGACGGAAIPCDATTPYCDETLDTCVECRSVSDCTDACRDESDTGSDPATYLINYYDNPLSCSAGACVFNPGDSFTCYGPSSDPYTDTIDSWCHGSGNDPVGCCGQPGFDCPK